MVTSHFIRTGLRYLLLAGMLSVLAGCGGGGSTATTGTTTNVATDVLLAGSVGDGPVTGATVSVYASDGSLLGAVVTDSSASFRSTVKARYSIPRTSRRTSTRSPRWLWAWPSCCRAV
jgi:hypothetical protein